MLPGVDRRALGGLRCCATRVVDRRDHLLGARAGDGALAERRVLPRVLPADLCGRHLLLRSRDRGLGPSVWLDGAIAGLAAATLGAAVLFEVVLDSTGGEDGRDHRQPGLPARRHPPLRARRHRLRAAGLAGERALGADRREHAPQCRRRRHLPVPGGLGDVPRGHDPRQPLACLGARARSRVRAASREPAREGRRSGAES